MRARRGLSTGCLYPGRVYPNPTCPIYLLYGVVAPGFPWSILIQTTLSPPSHLRLSGQRPKLGALSLTSLSSWSFSLLYAERGVFLRSPYSTYHTDSYRLPTGGAPMGGNDRLSEAAPYQEAISNSRLPYPYVFYPISYRSDLPYAYLSSLP